MPDPVPNAPAPPPASPPGLIDTGAVGTQPGVTGYNPAQATSAPTSSTGYTPEAFTVTPKQTVAGQVKEILDAGSPLLEQAQAKARQAANARGLINSTTAVTAGNRALYDVAMPIATADAATYERAATNTTGAKNTAAAFGAGAENTASLQDAQLETQTNQFNAGATNTSLQSAANASNTVAINKLNNESQQKLQAMVNDANLRNIMEQGKIQERLTEIGNKNKLALQNSASAAQVYNQFMANLGAIMGSPDFDYDWKMAASNNLVEGLNASLETMSVISGIPGIETTLNFA